MTLIRPLTLWIISTGTPFNAVFRLVSQAAAAASSPLTSASSER
jgi:hypothetical protein